MNINLVEEAFTKLEEKLASDNLNLSEYQVKLVEQLKKCNEIDKKNIRRIFELFEKYPNAQWGMPGELVHYIETLDGCLVEDMLISSINHCPVDLTLWMLNRQCNGKHTKEEIDRYCDIFKSVTVRENIDKTAVDSAEGFLKYQQNRLSEISSKTNSCEKQNNYHNEFLKFLGSIFPDSKE